MTPCIAVNKKFKVDAKFVRGKYRWKFKQQKKIKEETVAGKKGWDQRNKERGM